MPYAAEGRIGQDPIDGGIEITPQQYQHALAGMREGLHVQIIAGELFVGPLPVVEPAPEVGDPVPPQITRRQGRLALLYAGHLARVEAAMAAISDPVERMAAQIEYEAETWERANPWIERTGAAIELTPEQIDELFITAASL